MPSATNMPVLPSDRKGGDSFRSSCVPCEAATFPKPLAPSSEAESEGMHCIPSHLCRGKSGLSRVDLALLAYIMDHPETQGSRTEIAEECECAPNSVPRAAKRLEARELIERTPGGGSKGTVYRLGRNMQVTEARNTGGTRNTEDTTVVTSMLPAAACAEQTETTTTDGVVTAATGGRNIPPLEPPIRTTSNSETLSETPELRGVGGDLFAKPATAKCKGTKRRPKRAKFYAAEDNMLAEPNEAMREYAASKGMINGTLAEQFGKFRRWHIRERTLIACIEQRWETWADNWGDRNPKRSDGAPAGYKLAGVGADGKARYVKDQRTNVYR